MEGFGLGKPVADAAGSTFFRRCSSSNSSRYRLDGGFLQWSALRHSGFSWLDPERNLSALPHRRTLISVTESRCRPM